jgi:hypothetical protein
MEQSASRLCALGDEAREERGRWWRDALARSVISLTEHDDGFELTLRNDAQTLAEMNALVAAEARCCSWLNLVLEPGDVLTLRIMADSAEGRRTAGALTGEVAS